MMMYTSSPACHNQIAKFSKFTSQFQLAAIRDLLNKALQALKETPDECEKTFFNTTSFHCFHGLLFKIVSPQLNDQTDFDSTIKSLPNHFHNQNDSLDTFREHKKNGC